MPTKTRKRPAATEEGNRKSEGKAMKWTRNHSIIAGIGAAVAGAGAALFARRRWGNNDEPDAPAHRKGKTAPGPVGQSGAARSAGPEAMRDPPEEWDRADEASDESFPASDPPPVNSRVD